MRNHLPSQAYLLARLRYDEESGRLFWKPRSIIDFGHLPDSQQRRCCSVWNARYSGKEAFTAVNQNGYSVGNLDNRTYLAHRIIWRIIHGSEPELVDHINGDRRCNQRANLRSVGDAENARNITAHRDGVLGRVGVYPLRRTGRFRASICVDGKQQHLGVFATLAEAEHARAEASAAHGFIVRHRPHADRERNPHV